MKNVILSSIVAISAFALTSCEEKANWCPDGTEWSFAYRDCIPVACHTCGNGNGNGNGNGDGGTVVPPPATQQFTIESPFTAGNMRWVRQSDGPGSSGNVLYATTDCFTDQVIYSLEDPSYLNVDLNGMRSARVTIEWQIVQVINPAGFVNDMELPLFSGGYTLRNFRCGW